MTIVANGCRVSAPKKKNVSPHASSGAPLASSAVWATTSGSDVAKWMISSWVMFSTADRGVRALTSEDASARADDTRAMTTRRRWTPETILTTLEPLVAELG